MQKVAAQQTCETVSSSGGADLEQRLKQLDAEDETAKKKKEEEEKAAVAAAALRRGEVKSECVLVSAS